MAVRMRNVLARPWVGARVCHFRLLLLYALCSFLLVFQLFIHVVLVLLLRCFIHRSRVKVNKARFNFRRIGAILIRTTWPKASTRLVTTKNRLVCGKVMRDKFESDLTPTKNLQLYDKKSASVRRS